MLLLVSLIGHQVLNFLSYMSPFNPKALSNTSPLHVSPPNINPPKVLMTFYKPRAHIQDLMAFCVFPHT